MAWAQSLADTTSGRFSRRRAVATSLVDQAAKSWPDAQLPHFPAFASQ
jgi:hypothetical protein